MIDTDRIMRITKILLHGRYIGKNEADDYLELIAEVKRLREALLLIADTANGRPFVDGHIGLPLVHEVLKELIDE